MGNRYGSSQQLSGETMEEDGAKACFLWQYEHRKKWMTYSSKEIEAINRAYNKGQKTVTLPGGTESGKVAVIFKEMIQRNKLSGLGQRIQCCFFDDDSFYCWQWQDDDNSWHCFIPGVTLELESCHRQKKHKLNIYFNEADYELNLKDMIQKNEETGASHNIKRAKVTLNKMECALIKVAVESKIMFNGTNQRCDNENAVGSGPRPRKRRKIEQSSKEKNVCTKTLVFKGKAPVDPECKTKVKTAHVYVDGRNVYHAVLNQTNLQLNSNKYYILQLLEDYNSRRCYSVWCHWGRVGRTGHSKLIYHHNLKGAIADFSKRFYERTKNRWKERHNFKKKDGKYDMLKVDYNAVISDYPKLPKTKHSQQQLEPEVVSLIELICNMKMIEDTVKEMKYDAKKAPLGKLTEEQIKDGYAALKKIEDIILKNGKGSDLIQACNEFYTRIPHDFGLKAPPLIRSTNQIKEKMQMLKALHDIQIAVKMIGDVQAGQNPVYSHYKSLQCQLKPLNKNSATFNMLKKYMKNTHASTHSNFSAEIVDIFECHKEEEEKRFKDVGNRVLLWHGSRLTNFVGILTQSLRIAPLEAPSTGQMFGKGVYFADMFSKSANYCGANREKSDGLLLLCEVALGNCNKLLNANYQANVLPKGKHSVMGCGYFVPDPNETIKLDDGVKVPLGKPCQTKNNFHGLFYNEYIVYKVNQIKMKYLFRVKFNFKF